MSIEGIRNVGLVIFAVFAVSIVLGTLFLGIAVWKLRKLDIPPDAGFAETLHYTPLAVVIGVDLLDLALDVLAAPISWLVLDRLGLKGLRGVAAVEALIPGTQLIPTLTLSWFAVRLFGIGY
jgi:hypothetical protein